MSNIASTLSPWIPVIGTLAGAFLGFASSFGTSWWNAKKTEVKETKNRKRETFEDIYKTLITIRSFHQEIMGMCLNKIHYNIAVEPPKYEGIPPIIKVEMLIKLYGVELSDSWDQFTKFKDKFGKLYLEIFRLNYQSRSLKEKQKISSEIMLICKSIDDSIDVIHKKIASVIEL